MKTIKLSGLIILVMALSANVFASREEFKKTVSKSFEVNKDATLHVKNKFGKINCENWDKNSVSITVEISVEASSQEKANKIFDKITIDFSGSNSRVSAVTNTDDNLFNNNNDEISIDYTISMPSSMNIELDHKFGDILLQEVNGSSLIDLSYGSIKAKRLTNDNNNLEIKFSEAYIGYIKNAELELKYSELEIDEAVSMSAESKFSEFKISKIEVLTLESGYDDDFIGSIRDLDVEAGFSDIEVRSLDQRLVADIDYGALKVKGIAKSFSLIDVTSSFSETDLGFNEEASFRLVATVKMGDLSYPRDKAQLTEVELSYTSSKYEGLVGENKETTSKVMIDAKNGGVNLFYR